MAANVRPAGLRMTLAQYLSFEESSDEKHEYVNGVVRPLHDDETSMAGGSHAHAVIQSNLIGELHIALKGKPCRAYGSELRIECHDDDGVHQLYPDVMVVCGKAELTSNDCAVRNPVVIAEITSTSSAKDDRGLKFERYRSIQSFRAYLLLSQTEPSIDLFTKNDDGSWTFRTIGREGLVALTVIGVQVPIDEIYSGALDPSAGNPRVG